MATKDSKNDPAGSAPTESAPQTGHEAENEVGHEAGHEAGRGKSRRRPPPTLDLAATEVKGPAATPGAAAPDHAPTETPAPVPVLDADGAPRKDAETAEAEAASAPPEVADAPPPEPVHASELPGAPAEGPAPKRQMGLVAGLAAALASGVIGAAVAVAVVNTFYSAEQNADAITQLEARALDLRQRIEAIEGAAGTAAPAPAGNLAVPQELATRLDALESGLTDMGERVNELSDRAAPAPATSPEEVALLGNRLDALQQKVDALPAPAPAASPDEVNALSGRVEALQQRVAAIPAPPPAATPQDLANTNVRVAAVEEKLAAVAQRQQSSGQGAAQLVALNALNDAVRAGRPFATELKASRALLGEGGSELAGLESAAARGFATGPVLAERLRAATAPAPAPASQEPGAPAATGASGVLDRLVESAKGLVTVRRSDEAPADADRAAFATAEAQLARGDEAGALATLNALPAESRTAVQPVITDIEQRQAALATIAGLSQKVLASLAGGNQ